VPFAGAGETHVAVAQNFAVTCRQIAEAFTAETGHAVTLSAGSTGKLYAQIENGAPFDVLLSADAERPRRLEASGRAVAGSRFTYALGRLVLWSPTAGLVDEAGAVLASDRYRHLAIANPELAPYGAAAREVLRGLDLFERLAGRIVRGEDIGQTYQFVASGNAELGFVALAQLIDAEQGSRWMVPEKLHTPIEQQAVLLAVGRDEEGATAFLSFLRSPGARAQIERAGYGVPDPL
jgi:molybdate transport system substrate-binding protein